MFFLVLGNVFFVASSYFFGIFPLSVAGPKAPTVLLDLCVCVCVCVCVCCTLSVSGLQAPLVLLDIHFFVFCFVLFFVCQTD